MNENILEIPEIFLIKDSLVVNYDDIESDTSLKLTKKIEDLNLQPRSVNGLHLENINYVGDLVQHTEESLGHLNNLGRKSIEDIKDALLEINLCLGLEIQDWSIKRTENLKKKNIEKKKIKIKLNFKQISFIIKNPKETTLSVRATNALLNMGCRYMGDVFFKVSRKDLYSYPALGKITINEIEEIFNEHDFNLDDTIDPWNDEIKEKIIPFIDIELRKKKINQSLLKNETLEEELIRILEEGISTVRKAGSKKKKVIDIITNRFGLDGSPPKTLQIIAEKYNVTRERIRQNESYGIRKLQFSKPYTPKLEEVFEILSNMTPISELEFNKILKEKKITKNEWDFKGLKDFYESFNSETNFHVLNLNGVKIISKHDIDSNFSLVLNHTNKRIWNSGLFSIKECMNLKDIYINNIRKETIEKIVQTKKQFSWLDSNKNFFTYYAKRNRLSNLISKVAATSESVKIDILFDKIKNHARLSKDLNYNKHILLNFCKICFDCKIEDQSLIKFNSSISKLTNYEGYNGEIIGPNEQKLLDIFNNYGPILSSEDIKEFSENEKIGKDSLSMILQFSPIFHRIDYGFYKLVNNSNNEKMKKNISIINLESLTFSSDDCPPIKNKSTYIEINKNGNLFKSLPYQRPLRKMPDGSYGVVYKKKVYPISETFIENNGKRESSTLD